MVQYFAGFTHNLENLENLGKMLLFLFNFPILIKIIMLEAYWVWLLLPLEFSLQFIKLKYQKYYNDFIDSIYHFLVYFVKNF